MRFHHLLHDMAMKGALYFLGAGASVGLAPIGAQFREAMLLMLEELSGTTGSTMEDTVFRKTFGLSFKDILHQVSNERNMRKINRYWWFPNLSEAVCLNFHDRLLTDIYLPHEYPSQYYFFRLIPQFLASVITFNQDGLIHDFADHLDPIELHGSPLTIKIAGKSRRLSREEGIGLQKYALEYADLFGIKVWPQPVIVRPGDNENDSLWLRAYPLIANASTIIVIGYSFPGYDEGVRARFKLAIQGKDTHINILDLNARHVAGELSEYMKRDVIPWEIDWSCLSKAIVVVSQRRNIAILAGLLDYHKEIMALYYKYLGF